MPWYVVNGQAVHLNMGRRKAPKPCRANVSAASGRVHCMAISTLLCDWPVEGGTGTCDMPLCAEHGAEVGRDKHYCPAHLAKHREQNPELF